MALRADKRNLTKFSEQAEKLAEDFRRSLVVEGFTRDKAQELTIQKTIEMCRKSAKSESAKAVLSATKFETPNEVISKLIVEQNLIFQERLTSNFNRNSRGNNRGNFNQRNSNNRPDRFNNNNSFNNSGRGNFRNNQPQRGNFNHNRQNSNRSEQVLRIVSGPENSPGPSQDDFKIGIRVHIL